MDWIDDIENEIDKLKENKFGIKITKNIVRGAICADIVIPQNILEKDLTDEEIEFKLVVDTFSLKINAKLFCMTPYCFPHLADGRDLFRELRHSKNINSSLTLDYLLSDIIEFIKINYERGGLIFCGNYYLGAKYDLKIFQKNCQTVLNVKENLSINGKNLKFNRVLILSHVYFLLFQQEKWYKNNLTLLFWSSINNIEKIQKVKDNKTVILHWTTKDKESAYLMRLTFVDRETFIQDLLEKIKTFGMNFDINKVKNDNRIEKATKYSSSTKLKDKEFEDSYKKYDSQNLKLVENEHRKNLGKEYDKDDFEEEEDKKDKENEIKEEKNNSKNNDDKNNKNNKNNKEKNEQNNDDKIKNDGLNKIIEDEKNGNKGDLNKEKNIIYDEDINIDINIGKK